MLRGSSISVGLDTPLRGYSTSMFSPLRAIRGSATVIEQPSQTAHTMLIEQPSQTARTMLIE
ncbi:hypothetical protein HQQ82_11275 [Rathayibacter sp. VKM Ac-2856]|uniref:hypothetical protein n=1 Tax=Rathayibacter sp. VKM Ac-2858 TaxID=2739019 RepID=UPI001563C95B|nr:hypothetical protein [Rathayibacter sp. VKM Ac-2858]NQX05573.1 hypothetical protein [Rathayibacter sp. VKM Ac-2858]NQX20552.1 hypothetical protein [Rathayibacter sp. VKM Ac-2856]